ncbi:MAG: hypothetical protein RIR51_1545 [Bacteroidota bacterium]
MLLHFKKYVPKIGYTRLWSIFFFIMLLGSLELKAEKKLLPFRDISDEWVVYDADGDIFLPYLSSLHLEYPAKSLIIQENQFLNAFLEFNSKIDFDVFINGQYYKKIPAAFNSEKKPILNLNYLRKEFSDSKLVITLYNKNLIGLPDGVNLVRYREVPKVRPMEYRYKNIIINIFMFSLLIILLVVVFLKNRFPVSFKKYFALQDWVIFSNKNPMIYNSPYDVPNLSMLLILSLLASLISVNNEYFLAMESMSVQQLNQNFQLRQILWTLLKIFGISLFLFGSRFIVYFVVASIFNIPKIVKLHYFKNLQTNFQFYFIAFLVFLILLILNGPNNKLNIGLFGVFVNGFYLIRGLYYFLIFKKNLEIPNFVLIGYLILTEGQIAFFGIRWLILE